MRSHLLVGGRLDSFLRTPSTVFVHPSASATSEKSLSALGCVLTSIQNMPQKLVFSSQPTSDKCTLYCAKDSPVSDFICHLEADLTLALTTHTGQDEPWLLICRILAGESFDDPLDDLAPACKVRVRGAVHKPVLIFYNQQRAVQSVDTTRSTFSRNQKATNPPCSPNSTSLHGDMKKE